jgi:hypothetical protein
MYPTFCTRGDQPDVPGVSFAAVARAQGLGSARPGLALREEGDLVEVIVDLESKVERWPAASVRYEVPERLALALMEAVEEAIEDALEAEPPSPGRVSALERLLGLMEQAQAF